MPTWEASPWPQEAGGASPMYRRHAEACSLISSRQALQFMYSLPREVCRQTPFSVRDSFYNVVLCNTSWVDQFSKLIGLQQFGNQVLPFLTTSWHSSIKCSSIILKEKMTCWDESIFLNSPVNLLSSVLSFAAKKPGMQAGNTNTLTFTSIEGPETQGHVKIPEVCQELPSHQALACTIYMLPSTSPLLNEDFPLPTCWTTGHRGIYSGAYILPASAGLFFCGEEVRKAEAVYWL